MTNRLTAEIETFIAETGLSEHRVGILLAGNGRLVERLRSGSRVWPETEAKIRKAIRDERARRLTAPARAAS